MEQGDKIIEKWYIVWTQTKHRHWLVRFLERDLSHVYAIKESLGGQFWITVNPASSHLSVEIEPKEGEIRSYVGQDAVILPVVSHIDGSIDRFGPCYFSCVEVVKALLGIKRFWILTPYQLYKYLRRQDEHAKKI